MTDIEWKLNGRPILGIGHVPNRKRPFLYVQEGVHAEVVAYLQSEEAAEKLRDTLRKMMGIVPQEEP